MFSPVVEFESVRRKLKGPATERCILRKHASELVEKSLVDFGNG